jgi:glycosyltransferase involved in cell wall biosynthesis
VVHANNSATLNLPELVAARLWNRSLICHIRRIHTLSVLDKWAAERVTRFIAVSEAAKQNYVDQGIDEDRISVVHNSVPLDRFAPRPSDPHLRSELGLDPRIPCVGVLTRLVPLKGVHILIQACALAMSQGAIFQLLVVGGGPDEKRLRLLARDLGLEPYVRFVGEVRDVAPYIPCCDIVVQPSVEADAFPRSVIEAMACGKPVIGSRVGGIPEAIVDSESGLLVNPGSVEELASALIALLQNEQWRVGLGVKARHRAEAEFSPEVFAERIRGIYGATVAN